MLKQWLHKRAKVTYGILNTYVRKKGRVYNAAQWWDAQFYTAGVSDRQTIAPNKGVIAAKYHYASVEQRILAHLCNRNVRVNQSSVLDIGSGSGYWIDFYRALGANRVVGLDVALSSFNYLNDKYADTSGVHVFRGGGRSSLNSKRPLDW
ncbi:MAG TPA: class I SAM-dependent methyltransferase [Pseudomonadales bacterium]